VSSVHLKKMRSFILLVIASFYLLIFAGYFIVSCAKISPKNGVYFASAKYLDYIDDDVSSDK